MFKDRIFAIGVDLRETKWGTDHLLSLMAFKVKSSTKMHIFVKFLFKSKFLSYHKRCKVSQGRLALRHSPPS